MSLTSGALDPTVFGLGGDGGIPSANNVIITAPMKASSSLSKGDFVKLTSTSAGTVEKCTATSDTVYGLAWTDCDNSSGAAGDKKASILKKGFAYVDARVTASGVYDEPIRFNDVLYLCGSASEAADVAQRVTSTTDTGVGTAKIARAMDAVATPTATGLYRIRVYVDYLNGNMA